MQVLTPERQDSQPVISRSRITPVAIVLIALMAVGILYRVHQSNGFYWQDDYSHLLISRHALNHPSAILDVWGRPLMTLVYMPAAVLGELTARLTSLVLFAATAVFCYLVARRHRLPFPIAAALLLVAQPLAARLSFSAMTQTLFSLVLAIALWLRASKHPVAAALLVSLLPLARLEGLFVVAVWAVFLLLERRYRAIPALATGTAAWAIVGAITYRDPLWLWHANPYGILGSQYPTAGWSYIFYALPIAFGPVAGGLAIAALARRRLGDPMIGALALGLPLFYAFAWGAPAFQSFPDPVYLVSASVPIALCAHGCLASLLEPGTAEPRGRLASFAGSAAALMLVARLVAVNRGNPSISLFFLLLVVSGVVAWNIGLSLAGRPAMRSLERAAAIGLLGLAAATGLFRTTPLRLEREESLSKQAVDHLGERAADVVLWQDPAFGWYAGRDSMAPVIPLQQVPVGGLVELDSHHVDVKDPARLTTLGFQPVWAVQNHDAKLVLYRRVAPPVLAH